MKRFFGLMLVCSAAFVVGCDSSTATHEGAGVEQTGEVKAQSDAYSNYAKGTSQNPQDAANAAPATPKP